MNKRFRLVGSTALSVGLALAACEKRTEPSRESDRPSYQEPVREARPTAENGANPSPDKPKPTAELTTNPAADKANPTSDKTADHAEPARPSNTATTAQNDSAVSSITQARCDREARCNNVGGGKKFQSREDCVTKTRADWRDDLNARECPHGIVSSQLATCVTQIKDESCNNPAKKLESVLACRTVDLCKNG